VGPCDPPIGARAAVLIGGGNIKPLPGRLSSIAAIDPQLLYAAPNHLVCPISGY
jgi:hypothetical protein